MLQVGSATLNCTHSFSGTWPIFFQPGYLRSLSGSTLKAPFSPPPLSRHGSSSWLSIALILALILPHSIAFCSCSSCKILALPVLSVELRLRSPLEAGPLEGTAPSVMMCIKASSDDTTKNKQYINNAKQMQIQCCKMRWNAKNAKKTICPLNKSKKRPNKCNNNAPKKQKMQQNMHKTCKTNAIKKQNKCDQKRSSLCPCMFCFVFACCLHFLCVCLEETQKNRKIQQIAKTNRT